jgi:hypothetical protein
MELEALHQPRVRQSLEPALGRRRRASGIEAAVDLAREHMPQLSDEGQDLEVQRIRIEPACTLGASGPPNAGCAIQREQLAIALGRRVGHA